MDKTSQNHKFLKKAIDKLNDLKQVLVVTSEDLEFNLKNLDSIENSDETNEKIKTIVSRLEITCKMGCEELETVKNNVVDGFNDFKKLPVKNGQTKNLDKIDDKMEVDEESQQKDDETKIKQIRVISIEKLMNPKLLKETASTSKTNTKLNSSKIIVLDSDSDDDFVVTKKNNVETSEKSRKSIESDSEGESIKRRRNLRNGRKKITPIKKLSKILDSDSDDDLPITKKSNKNISQPKIRKVTYDKDKIKIQNFKINVDKLPKNLDKLMIENGVTEILNHKQKVIATLDSDKIVKNCDNISNSSKSRKSTDSDKKIKSKKDDENDSNSDEKENSCKTDSNQKSNKEDEKDSDSDEKRNSRKNDKKSKSKKDPKNDSESDGKKNSRKNDKKSKKDESSNKDDEELEKEEDLEENVCEFNEKETSNQNDEEIEKEMENGVEEKELEENNEIIKDLDDEKENSNKEDEEMDILEENQCNEEVDMEGNDKNDKKKTNKQNDAKNDETSRKTSSDSEINKNEVQNKTK